MFNADAIVVAPSKPVRVQTVSRAKLRLRVFERAAIRVARVFTRVTRRVARAAGPERIAPEWWIGDDEDEPLRDYYRVEDTAGRRYWLYRAGLYQDSAAKGPPRWYVHGLYG